MYRSWTCLQVYNMQVTHCSLTYHKTCHTQVTYLSQTALAHVTNLSHKATYLSHKGHIFVTYRSWTCPQNLSQTGHILVTYSSWTCYKLVTYRSHTCHIQLLHLLETCHILVMYFSHTGHILVTYNFWTC